MQILMLWALNVFIRIFKTMKKGGGKVGGIFFYNRMSCPVLAKQNVFIYLTFEVFFFHAFYMYRF